MPRCLCPADMKLDADGKRCLTPEALLIYARQSDIRRLSLGTDVVADENDILVNSGVEEACAVDCHVSDSRIYWTDTKTKVSLYIVYSVLICDYARSLDL